MVAPAAGPGPDSGPRAPVQPTAPQRAANMIAANLISGRPDRVTGAGLSVQLLRAVALGRQLGAGAGLLRSVTDKAQDFHDRDMYVFVLDRGGAYLAFGGNEAKVGTRVQDIVGVDGARLLADIWEQADRGPGWVEYDITNPLTGKVQTKMSFVHALGDWVLGCGVYKSFSG